MAKYKVKAGIFIRRGKTFRKGQVVESEGDLVKAFPQKFTPLEKESAAVPVSVDGSRIATTRELKTETPGGEELKVPRPTSKSSSHGSKKASKGD